MSQTFHNNRFHMGVAAIPGTRPYMQDRYSIQLSRGLQETDVDFLGVFDGHGPNGGKIAEHISQELPRLAKQKLKADPDADFQGVITDSYVQLDREMKGHPCVVCQDGMTGGSTAASLWIKDNVLYASNVGDSRIIMSVGGRKINLSLDHRPTLAGELSRIGRSGGHVRFQRVGSVLAVSRAFGDYEFKDEGLAAQDQIVSPVPNLTMMRLPEKFDFILLATDGLFDYLSERTIIKYISRKRSRGKSLDKICSKILQDLHTTQTCLGQCPRELDNITVILAVPHRTPKCLDCKKHKYGSHLPRAKEAVKVLNSH